MSFRFVPNSVTLNDLERRNIPRVCVISPDPKGAATPHFGTRSLLYFLYSKHCDRPICLATKIVDLWRN